MISSPEIAVSGRVNDLTIGTVSKTEVTVTVNGVTASGVQSRLLGATDSTLPWSEYT